MNELSIIFDDAWISEPLKDYVSSLIGGKMILPFEVR